MSLTDLEADLEIGIAPRRPVRVMVLDGRSLIRTALRSLLERRDGVEVVAATDDGDEASVLAAVGGVDVAVIATDDLRIDGVLEIVRRLGGPATPAGHRVRTVLVCCADPGGGTGCRTRPRCVLSEAIFAALDAGADAVMGCDTEPAQLVEAIHAVAAGDALLSPQATRTVIDALREHLIPPPRPRGAGVGAELTERQWDVLKLVVAGLAIDQVADRLVITASTVKTHLRHIMALFGVHDRAHLVMTAYELGLVKPGWIK
ncbi:LuxR C-terminal-related transcriptional regulator [Spirillospora sp. NPDC127200]